MSTSMHGKIGWSELVTSDVDAAIAYYTAMFGWETEPYVSVENLDASLEKGVELGGETLFGPMEVPSVGRIAVVKDAQGAVIGLHEPL